MKSGLSIRKSCENNLKKKFVKTWLAVRNTFEICQQLILDISNLEESLWGLNGQNVKKNKNKKTKKTKKKLTQLQS